MSEPAWKDEGSSTRLVRARPAAWPVAPALEAERRQRERARRRLDPRLVLLAEPRSERAAAFRLLCDSLITKGLPRVLAVSSTAPKEGKTTCAVNLALVLAERSPGPVLLVDGNPFEPALATMFSIDESTPTPRSLELPWLAPFRLIPLTPTLHVAAIVRGGGEPPSPTEHDGFEILIERLSQVGYEHVFVDCPTLDGSAAVSRLLGVAEGVLLAVRSGRTTGRALRQAVEQIGQARALGVVLLED